ncbi:ORF6N domain-containing protein [Halomonas sp. OfavH-34-E]|uniref:ORF6N domain-containing protein n=1 Tax=Halomonas sp. OfavH-34-E TaxID=2954491 RepID=UPI002098511D|nr:ORF6N domain-containing protein [Halomonas sp. OfavH-34-E]MCO7217102.1 ORF6N domain-containing protein [Halomonas sp. OfavH-34-E]
MHTPTVRVADVDLPFIEYHSQPVVTFAMIDAAHQRPARTSRRNFDTNRKHFVERDDFYRLDSEGLHEIRASYPDLFPAAASSVTLFTETGYLMLVKSFSDDLAWKVQRQLVKGYFRARSEQSQPTTTPPIPETINHQQRQQLRNAIADLFNNGLMRSDVGSGQWLYNRLRVEHGLKRIEDLPAQDFTKAMATVESLKPRIAEFLRLESHLRQMFYAEVIGNGEPWTPWIAKHLGGTHKLPSKPDWPALARQTLENHGLISQRH